MSKAQLDKGKMLSMLAEATGLKRETVKDLMKTGWVYEERLDSFTAHFVKPINQMRS